LVHFGHHPSIHPSIHWSGHGVLVAVGSFWPCQWYIVLWPGGPSQQQHGQNPEKKKVGLFERFSLRYCCQQKQEFRAGMKFFHFIIKSKQQNNQTNKQTKLLAISALPWFSGQPGLRVLRLLYPM
jgi:hypothetical protein